MFYIILYLGYMSQLLFQPNAAAALGLFCLGLEKPSGIHELHLDMKCYVKRGKAARCMSYTLPFAPGLVSVLANHFRHVHLLHLREQGLCLIGRFGLCHLLWPSDLALHGPSQILGHHLNLPVP